MRSLARSLECSRVLPHSERKTVFMTALCTSPRRQRQFYRDTVCLHWFVVASGLAYVKDFVLFFFFFSRSNDSPLTLGLPIAFVEGMNGPKRKCNEIKTVA